MLFHLMFLGTLGNKLIMTLSEMGKLSLNEINVTFVHKYQNLCLADFDIQGCCAWHNS